MNEVRFRWRAGAVEAFEAGMADGLRDAAQEIASAAAGSAFITTGATAASIGVNDQHLGDKRRPAAFVTTSTGVGFWVHSATRNSPAYPFFSSTLDAYGGDRLAEVIGRRMK